MAARTTSQKKSRQIGEEREKNWLLTDEKEHTLLMDYQQSLNDALVSDLLQCREEQLRCLAKKNAYLNQGDADDLYAELRNVWWNCIKRYRPKGAPFGGYLSCALKNKLTAFTQKQGRRVAQHLFETADDVENVPAPDFVSQQSTMDEASIIKMVAKKDVGVRKAMERYFSGRFSNLRDACRWKKVELKMYRLDQRAIYYITSGDQTPESKKKFSLYVRDLLVQSGKCRKGFKFFKPVSGNYFVIQVEVLDNCNQIFNRVRKALERVRPKLEPDFPELYQD